MISCLQAPSLSLLCAPGRLPQRSKDVAFATSSIVEFLLGSLCWPSRSVYKLPSWIALGRDGTHLINVEDGTVGRWALSQQFDGPLFSANCGSMRSPNQPSCLRHRKPSACSSCRIRL